MSVRELLVELSLQFSYALLLWCAACKEGCRRNIEGNQPIVELVQEYADRKNAAAAQISLAWMLKKYPNVVPIPGSKNKGRIIENLDASRVELSDEEFKDLDSRLNSLKVYGHRGFTR